MVFAEFFIASYGLPIDFAASLYYGWKLGRKLCLATGFILTSSGEKFTFLQIHIFQDARFSKLTILKIPILNV